MKCPRLAVIIFCFVISACGGSEELAGGLSGRQSVEMMVVLRGSGIQAERVSSGSGVNTRYQIRVSKGDLNRAFSLLQEYRMPKDEEVSFEQLTGSDNLIPDVKAISQLRLDRALALEIERSVELLPNVVDVRAIVRSNLVIPAEGPRASVVIRYTARSGAQPFSEDEVRQRILDAVPGIAPNRISVTSSRVVLSNSGAGELGGRTEQNPQVIALTELEPFSFLVPTQDKRRVLGLISSILLLFSLASGVLGYAVAVAFRRKRPLPQRVVKSAVLETTFRPPTTSGTTPVVRPPTSTASTTITSAIVSKHNREN